MKIGDAIAGLKADGQNVRFDRLVRVCTEFFGSPRINGSHHVFKMQWAGDPRINLQAVRGRAKPYQVRDVLAALERLREMEERKL